MKILITGATGLIGKELGRELVGRGHRVLALVRDPKGVASHLPFPAESFSWREAQSETPSKAFLEALAGVDAIVHLAGEPIADGRWTTARKRALRESRVDLTQALVGVARAHMPKLKVFVQGSALGIYGERGDEELDAGSEVGSGFLPNLVRDWEEPSLELARNSPRDAESVGEPNNEPSNEPGAVRVVALRTGIVLARQGGALAKMLPVFRRGLGARLGLSGRQWMSWIHLADIVGLICWALETPSVKGVIEGTSPNPVRNAEFTKVLCKTLGVMQAPPVPALALRALFGEMADVLLESTKLLPRRAQELGYRFRFPSFDLAMQDLVSPLRGRIYEKLEEQWVPVPVEKIWPYFCDEKNLESLTPPMLRFEVLGKSTPEIQTGTLIDYRLSLNGLPFGWRTRIEDWVPNRKFVDSQIKGPYSLWHHTHEFLPLAGGTLMRDRVFYRLPMGILGDLAASWKVVRDVDAIFQFRRKVIHEKFGAPAEKT